MRIFETFLTELGKVVDIPGLKPDRFDACLLVMKKEGAHLLFELDEHIVPGTILLSTPIVSLESTQLTLLKQALSANEKNDATLSVKEDEHLLYLHDRLSPQLNAEEIKPLMDKFLAYYVYCQDILNKTPISETSPSNPQPPSLHFKA